MTTYLIMRQTSKMKVQVVRVYRVTKCGSDPLLFKKTKYLLQKKARNSTKFNITNIKNHFGSK